MKKPEGFKRAYYRSIPCYYNPRTEELIGRNKFYDILTTINVWWDINIIQVEEFPILIEEE